MSEASRPAYEQDEIDELRDHCLAFIAERYPQRLHAVIMAKPALAQMIFWLRAAKTMTARISQ